MDKTKYKVNFFNRKGVISHTTIYEVKPHRNLDTLHKQIVTDSINWFKIEFGSVTVQIVDP